MSHGGRLTHLFEDWCQAGENWGTTSLVSVLRKKRTHTRVGKLKWLTEKDLMDLYGDESLVQDLIGRKAKENACKPHPDFPQVAKMRLYKCFVVEEESLEDAAEESTTLRVEAEVDQEGLQTLRDDQFRAFTLHGDDAPFEAHKDEDEPGGKKPGGKAKAKAKPQKKPKEVSKEQIAAMNAHKKIRDLNKWNMEANHLIDMLQNSADMLMMPELMQTLVDTCKKFSGKFKDYIQKVDRLLECKDWDGMESLMTDIGNTRSQFLNNADTVKRTIPKQKKDKAGKVPKDD